MQSLRTPSPARGSPLPRWRRPRSPVPNPSSSPRTSATTHQTPAVTNTATPPPPPPPRQSLVYGPFTSTAVTTVVREDKAAAAAAAAAPVSSSSTTRRGEEQSSLAQRRASPLSSSRPSASPLRHATPTSEELRELRQTRSLFLCGRGLLSLRHIAHLQEMLSLRFLSVHMNAITQLERGCLSALRHLVELDLSANEIAEVPLGCWTGLARLERLNLSSNLLTHLDPGAFRGLGSLQWLSLGFNRLSDVGGLSSVPAEAPLAYVDLCANRIATVEAVLQVLAPHRQHLRELRLSSPDAAVVVAGREVGEESAADASLLNSSYWQVEENPLCGPTGKPGKRMAGGPAGTAPPPYVRQLLFFFPNLLVVNGVAYGVDPLDMLLGAATVQEGETRSPPAVEKESGADDFTRLLSQPLPRLPSPSSSSPSSSSLSFERVSRQRRSHSRARSLGASSQRKHRAASRGSSRIPSPAKQQAEVQEPTPPSASSGSSIRSAAEDEAERSRPPQFPAVTVRGGTRRQLQREPAPGPRRATLRRSMRRRSAPASTSPASHAISATAAPRGSAATVAPHARHQQYLSAVSEQSRAGQDERSASSPQQPPSGPMDGTVDTTERSCRRCSVPHAGATPTPTPTAVRSVPGCSPSGITDTSDRTPSPDLRAAAQPHRPQHEVPANGEGIDVYSVDMSGNDSSTSRPVSPVERSAQPRRPLRFDSAVNSDDGSGGGGVAGLGGGRATPQSAATPAHRMKQTTSSSAISSKPAAAAATTSPPFSTVASGLRWKPKQASRGTTTDAALLQSEENSALATAAVEQEQRRQAQVEQLEAQLALRTATITDLRRHLALTRGQYVEAQREAQQRQQRLQSQVSALKDELARRGEETVVVQRTQQAQLNRAVESVKAEWTRRLEDVEQHHAAVLASEAAQHATAMSAMRESSAQLQQTCAMKTAQLTTLERQVSAMEGEVAALRTHALAQRQDTLAHARLLVAEAEERRRVEAAAATARFASAGRVHLFWSQQHQAAMRAVSTQLRDARERLDQQACEHAAEAAAYEAALQHAAGEMQQLRERLHCPPQCQVLPRPLTGEETRVSSEASPATAQTRDSASSHQELALVSTLSPADIQASPLPASSDVATTTANNTALVLRDPSAPGDGVSLAAYWRDAHARTEEMLRRVEAALRVATSTHQSLAQENTRLLHRVDSAEAAEATHRAQCEAALQVAAQERENLLRTLHTLRADMEKKDGALDALEEEAHAKLNEKRRRIAELENAVEAATAQHTRATEMNVSYRAQLEAAEHNAAELQRELAQERERLASITQQQTTHLPEMERKQREMSELLATHVAQAHQHELEKKTLVQALMMAREQLLCLQEANAVLAAASAGVKEQMARQQAELEIARQQLKETQEASRAQQRATREVLSRLMATDAL